VSDFYARKFSSASRIAFKNEPVTNFNNYPIWNKDGKHPVVDIGIE
jgi:hypothetical protein